MKLSQPQTNESAVLAFIGEQAENTFQIRERLRKAKDCYKSSVSYPEGDLGPQLRRAAQIIAGNLGTRVIFASLGGFDTHSGQADEHAALMPQLAASLAAFQQDLEQLRLADRVATMVFSEFGRRVDENPPVAAPITVPLRACFCSARKCKADWWANIPAWKNWATAT